MEIRHGLKRWEKRWGYLAFNKEDIAKLFYDIRDERFSVFIEDTELFARKIDRWGRIWVGRSTLSQFEVGDILIFSKDSSGKYQIRKE